MKYADPSPIRRDLAAILKPPTRVSVSEAAERSLRIVTPGGYRGPWDRDLFPYMAEPMDMMRSRLIESMIFVGPAQSGKTFSLLGGGIAHAAVYDPADQLVIQMTQDSARDWSRKELDRWIRASPDIHTQLSPQPRDNNTYDKFWRTGAIVKIGWPSVTQLSSKSVRDVLITDYDRMPDDIDGEGSAFGLGRQRTKVWRSRGITVVESSPGRDIEEKDRKWSPKGHEPPPVGGVVGLYAHSDRCRWYWPCPHCGEFWQAEPGLGAFNLPPVEELIEILRSRSVSSMVGEFGLPACPHCGEVIDVSHKRGMNLSGRWVADGQEIDRDGAVTGDRRTSVVAGYWLGGIAAAFQDWPKMVERYLHAVEHYGKTGEVVLLKQTVNTDQSMPFLPPRATMEMQTAGVLQQIGEGFPKGTVPSRCKFVIGTVDVQGRSFVAQWFGISPADDGRRWEWTILDRQIIKKSERFDEDGDRILLEPAAYSEDWDVLRAKVIDRTFAVQGKPNMSLPTVFTVCDSGGTFKKDSDQKEGVTEKAYAFWRKLNANGLGNRFRLVKGRAASAKRVEEAYPDTSRRKDRGASRGDVPVLMVSTDTLKDSVNSDLKRAADGYGGAYWPDWLPDEVFDEMTAENRTQKGWECPPSTRNEAFDLAVYCRAACIFLQVEEPRFWANPPPWATDRALLPTGEQLRPARTQQQRRRAVRSSGVSV